MENKKLLSLAAKAVNGGYWHPLTHTSMWNPIENDDQAFQLSVELGMSITQTEKDVKVTKHFVIDEHNSPTVYEKYINHKGDKFTATRLAIVKCAAIIYKETVTSNLK